VSLRVVVEADGGSRGNPGPAGYGAVVRDEMSGEVLAERKESIGVDTNNVAEYLGLIAGLQAASELGATSVLARMDSKLVVEQVSGRWQVKNERLRPLARRAVGLGASFEDIRYEWIPRERNRHADRLANEAMDASMGRTTESGVTPPASWTPPAGPATRLLVVRHAATQHTAERRFSGRLDVPLNDVGVQQAQQLAERIGMLDDIALVASSPLHRASETAARIADRLGTDVRVIDGLTELDFGAWDGRTFDDVAKRWPDELRAWSAGTDAAPPGGESLASISRRVRRARDEVIAMVPGRRAVVVTHVTPAKILLRLALDAPMSVMNRLHLDAASVSVVDYFADGTTSVRLVNDTGRLDHRD
jgi:ribonuclease H / adenosylcobalamin/alpha-ribazole phosphatase